MDLLISAYDTLHPALAYQLWRLRQDVFVIEQDCPYPDLDGRDTETGTRHVLLVDDAEPEGTGSRADGVVGGVVGGVIGTVVGCARLLDDGDVWRIGRVALARTHRGRGLADRVVQAALDTATGIDGARDVVLDAQTAISGWYASFGFSVSGPDFVEDGIPHTPMRLRRP